MTDDVITLDVACEDILWQMFFCCGLTFFFVKNCQSYKAFKKNCLKGFCDIFFMIIIIYFYNYHLLNKFSTTVGTRVKPQDTFSMLYLNQQYHPNFTTTFNFVTSSFLLMGHFIFSVPLGCQ